MAVEHPFEDAFPDPNAEKEKDVQAEIARRRYEAILKTQDGRWVMWVFLNALQTYNPVHSAEMMGMQSGGMAIRDTLKSANLELYHKMILENDK